MHTCIIPCMSSRVMLASGGPPPIHWVEYRIAWQARTGEVPDWLLLDNETITACAGWLNTHTWAESREYLLANAGRLLSDTGKTALAEIAFDYPDDPTITGHQTLLDTCRHAGVEPAYRSLLIGETTRAWRSLSNPNESKRFLVEHRDQLLTDEAMDTLQQDDDLLGQALL
jgi:hypothetical protein